MKKKISQFYSFCLRYLKSLDKNKIIKMIKDNWLQIIIVCLLISILTQLNIILKNTQRTMIYSRNAEDYSADASTYSKRASGSSAEARYYAEEAMNYAEEAFYAAEEAMYNTSY